MEKVLELDLDVDIEPLYRYLQSQRVGVQISEERGKQIVWVNDAAHRPIVMDAAQRYLMDTRLQDQVRSWFRGREIISEPVFSRFVGYPVICLLLLSLLVTALWTGFGQFDTYQYFLILDRYAVPFPQMANPMEGLKWIIREHQFWRLIAPAWLHWGVLHWLFNSLALWIFGRSLEKYLGPAGFILLVFCSALIGNLGQFIMSGPGFAGFSGVVYALIGAHAAGFVLAPKKDIWVSQSLVVMSILWMFMGIFGLSDLFSIHLANTAHVLGFMTGLVGVGLLLKLRD